MYEYIPEELKKLNKWVCWRLTDGRKVPINARTGGHAQSNNPDTWSDFTTAVNAAPNFSGIGFVLSGGSGIVGVDIDTCMNPHTGEISSEAAEIISLLDSYTEISPSGYGVHIFVYASCDIPFHKKPMLPNGIERIEIVDGKEKHKEPEIEFYNQGRYFTITGKAFGKLKPVAERTEELNQVLDMFAGRGKESEIPETSPVRTRPRLSKGEDDILSLAMNSRQGLAFSALYSGNWQDNYNSQSEADMALCSMLAFWCGRDIEMMDKLFRRSGLMRDKWNRKQSGTTYGAITLKRAVDTCSAVYSPQQPDAENYFIEITGRREPKQYTFDDMGNARRMLDLFGEKIRFNYNDKKWLFYDKIKWRVDSVDFIRQLADKSIESMAREAQYYEAHDEDMAKAFQKHIKSCRSNKSKNAMIDEIKHHVPIMPGDLDKNKMLLNTPNCIINLKTLEQMIHDPELYITKSVSIEYDPTAECPLWLSFLNDIFSGDKELISYIQRAVGYSLTGSTSEQCAFFLYGTGRNGKSTFLDIVRELCGDYARNIQPETIMVKSSNSSANSDIARLKGARFVTSVEPNEGMRINEGLLKQLTGDDVVTARKLYSDEFEFKPEFKLWMSTNHKPTIRGTDTGIWRRVHMIPFEVQIPPDKVDKDLKDKLLAEIKGIFAWAVEGVRMYNAQGLKMPAAVVAAVEEYRAEMDVISSFISACCVLDPTRHVRAGDLYSVYSSWCQRNNEYCMSSTKFGTEVAKRFQKMKLRTHYIYCGLDLNEEYKPYEITVGAK